MPLYELICPKCRQEKEEFLKLNEQEPVCDKCGVQMRKAMSAPAFILKGTCWASDSYGLNNKKNKATNKSKLE